MSKKKHDKRIIVSREKRFLFSKPFHRILTGYGEIRGTESSLLRKIYPEIKHDPKTYNGPQWVGSLCGDVIDVGDRLL